MTRTDDDSWDIASGVGSTAVMVAAARATETSSDNPLISDPFAAVLVGGGELAELMGKLTALQDTAPEFAAVQQQMVDYHAARSYFFDGFCISASEAGVRQFVILAAGLDSRAFRLSWPERTTVYEIDQPKVLEYKAATLAAHGDEPIADWHRVGIDLRHDWPKALQDVGFDPAVPTGWLAEGLLPFLPGPAQDAMFANIDSLSAPGSRIALEEYSSGGSMIETVRRQQAHMEDLRGQLDEDEVFDPGDVWYDDVGRSNPAEWFAGRGWRTYAVAARGYLAQVGRTPRNGADELFPLFSTFVTAEMA